MFHGYMGGIKKSKTSKSGLYEDRVALENDLKQKQDNPEIKREEKSRRNLNAAIVEYIRQGWPTEEIEKAISKEFPNESREKIKGLISHWTKKTAELEIEVDRVLKQQRDSGMSLKLSIKSIMEKYNNSSLHKKIIKDWINRKIQEKEEERQ